MAITFTSPRGDRIETHDCSPILDIGADTYRCGRLWSDGTRCENTWATGAHTAGQTVQAFIVDRPLPPGVLDGLAPPGYRGLAGGEGLAEAIAGPDLMAEMRRIAAMVGWQLATPGQALNLPLRPAAPEVTDTA